MAESKKTWHVHACRHCRLRYEDNCKTPKDDEQCVGCRGGHPFQLLVDGARPRDCCVNSRLVTKDEKSTYRLAGTANWFICPTCKRTQSFKAKASDVFAKNLNLKENR